MRRRILLLERLAMMTVGGSATAALQIASDLQVFGPCHLSWAAFLAPAAVGVSLSLLGGRFKEILFAGAITPAATLAAYFGLYALLALPPIRFHGAAYPPDPATRFILYFLANELLSLIGVVLGGLASSGN